MYNGSAPKKRLGSFMTPDISWGHLWPQSWGHKWPQPVFEIFFVIFSNIFYYFKIWKNIFFSKMHMYVFKNILHYNNQQQNGKKSQRTPQKWLISAWGHKWPHSVWLVAKIAWSDIFYYFKIWKNIFFSKMHMYVFKNILHYNNQQQNGKKSQRTPQKWLISAWGHKWPHSVWLVAKIAWSDEG